MRSVFLLDDVHDNIGSLVKDCGGPLSPREALFLDIFEAPDWRNVLVVELIPAIKLLWVEVWDVVQTVKGYKSSQNKESWILSSLGWGFSRSSLRSTMRTRCSMISYLKEISQVKDWGQKIINFCQKLPARRLASRIILETERVHVRCI